jgi:hypothetical protein
MNLEPTLQFVDKIQLAAGDIKGALRINDDPDPRGVHEEIPVGGRILKVHFVLETGAASAHHGNPENALRPALPG